ncbi:MAG: methyl-accepting chemotaxis protein [Treponema sp.]|jgi:methyl-accepting chemotaxis protein|nr:methyl-accepting chemotaxis protein [Treponema sp.]
MKLAVRVSLLAGLLVLVTAAGIGTAALVVSTRALEDAARAALMNEAAINAQVAAATLRGQINILQELANRERTQTMDWDVVQPGLIPDVIRSGYLDMALVYPDGQGWYVLGERAADMGKEDYLLRALEGTQGVSDIRVDGAAGGKPVVTYAVPVKAPGGPVLGALAGKRDAVGTLGALLGLVTTSYQTGYGFFTGRDGTMAAHQDTTLVLNRFNPVEAARTDSSLASLGETVAAAVKEKTGISGYVYQGKARVSAYTEIPGFPWMLFISVEQEEFTRGLLRLRYILALCGGVFVAAGVIIAAFIGRSIAAPVKGVAAILRDISEGEGDLTRRIPPAARDEIGDMARCVNRTLDRIKGLVGAIKQETINLSGIGSDLASNMAETAAAINKITAHIQSVQGRISGQTAGVTHTNAAMERINGAIGRLNGHVENQARSLSESSGAVEEMIRSITSVTATLAKTAENAQDLLEASGVGRGSLREVAADIQEIARESAGLLEINEVMETIASQTNLLSMNAAIEAAHAGEAGRGFAVVAGEIRKLAENAARQSQTTGGVLKKIKGSIDKITASTGAVLEKFGAIDGGAKTVSEQTERIRDAMESQNTGSRRIQELMDQLNGITRLVMEGSRDMLEGSQEVIVETRELEAAAQEIAGGMNEMAAGASRINEAVDHVHGISGRNRTAIEGLAGEVARFKID